LRIARRWALSALLAASGFLRTHPQNYQISAHFIPKFTACSSVNVVMNDFTLEIYACIREYGPICAMARNGDFGLR
jgi:hypothetical protein